MMHPKRSRPLAKVLFPFLEWLKGYDASTFRSDATAGLTVAVVLIPQAMAYAAIAGLPVQVGLYTALVPMLIYVLLGTSRPLSVSSTSTISMLTATELARVAQGGDPARASDPRALDRVQPDATRADDQDIAFHISKRPLVVVSGERGGEIIIVEIAHQTDRAIQFANGDAGHLDPVKPVFLNIQRLL